MIYEFMTIGFQLVSWTMNVFITNHYNLKMSSMCCGNDNILLIFYYFLWSINFLMENVIDLLRIIQYYIWDYAFLEYTYLASNEKLQTFNHKYQCFYDFPMFFMEYVKADFMGSVFLSVNYQASNGTYENRKLFYFKCNEKCWGFFFFE